MVRALRVFSASLVALVVAATLLIAISTPAHAATVSCDSWVRVVDVSSNNIHPIKWQNLTKARVAGAYIKNSENTNYVNPFWKSDTAQAQKAGIPYGGYYFAQPGLSDPIASARFFVNNGGHKGQLPPALDLEVTKLKPYDTAVWSLKWLQEVQRLSGRKPIIYVGYYFPASQYKILAPYDLWLPAYSSGYKPVTNVCTLARPKIPNPWATTGWQMWQFTSVATFPGVSGRQDMSVALPSWFSKWTGAGIQPNKDPNKPGAPLYSYDSHGTKVKQIQRLLISRKLLPAGSDDGVFGIQTKTAVRKWQATIGVVADGMWSVATQTASDYYVKNGRTLARDTKLKSMGSKMPVWKTTL
jgi:lysozyme